MSGTLAGIARHPRPKAPMETVARARVTLEEGVHGDFRGAMKGKPYKRQVTLIERGDWDTAIAAVGHNVGWEERRVNLLIDGLDLPQRPGARLRVGTALLEVTAECDPCNRMDAIADGLQAALKADWRGGVCSKVVEAGEIAVGDPVIIEE
ncbi:MAG: MOSC domain-containing protein [Pseudomonadota bacterium]